MQRPVNTRGTRLRPTALFVIALTIVSGCGGSAHQVTTRGIRPSTTSASSPRGASESLRAAAIAWSKAFLTGPLDEIAKAQGPECGAFPDTSSSVNDQVSAMYLLHIRDVLRHQTGVALNSIRIRGVLVRKVTATSGEAEVQYDLPASATGNDNWVGYELRNGQWKVADCHAPIGGSSSSSSSATPTTSAAP